MVIAAMVLAILASAVIPQPAAAASPAAATQHSIRSFVTCIVKSIKTIPEAKKLSPKAYQEMEAKLTSALNAIRGQPLNPYLAAIKTGTVIGKFIAFNMIWYIGAIQSCWYQLPK